MSLYANISEGIIALCNNMRSFTSCSSVIVVLETNLLLPSGLFAYGLLLMAGESCILYAGANVFALLVCWNLIGSCYVTSFAIMTLGC